MVYDILQEMKDMHNCRAIVCLFVYLSFFFFDKILQDKT